MIKKILAKRVVILFTVIVLLVTAIVALSLPFRFYPSHMIVRQVNCISCHAEEFQAIKTGIHIKPMNTAQNNTVYDYVTLYANTSDLAYKAIVAPCYTCHVSYEGYNLFALTDPYIFPACNTTYNEGNLTISEALTDAQYGTIVEWPYPFGNAIEEINNDSNATVSVQLQLLSLNPSNTSLGSTIMILFANYSGQQTGNISYQNDTTLSQNQSLQTLTTGNMANDYFNIRLILDQGLNFNNATLSLTVNGIDNALPQWQCAASSCSFNITVNGTFGCNAGCDIYNIPKDFTGVSYFKTNGTYKTVRLDAIWNAWGMYSVNGNITSSETIDISTPGGWVSGNTCSTPDGMCHITQETTFLGMSDGYNPDKIFYPHKMESVTSKQCKVCHLEESTVLPGSYANTVPIPTP